MKVKILKSSKHTGVIEGEIYEAIRYHLDPQDKVTLLKRIPDGHVPNCNEYRYNVEILKSTKA